MEKRLKFALQILRLCCPHFTQLLSVCDIRFDSRIKTAGIFPSGIVVLSPEYCATLSVPGIAYVIGHELYHFQYRIFDRITDKKQHYLANVAHDIIVNNKMDLHFLHNGMGNQTPPGLFRWMDFYHEVKKTYPKLKKNVGENYSLETLMVMLEKSSVQLPPSPFCIDKRKKRKKLHPWQEELDKHFTSEEEDDNDWQDISGGLPEIFSEEQEREFFPEESAGERNQRKQKILQATEDTRRKEKSTLIVKKIIEDRGFHQGSYAGNLQNIVKSLASNFLPDWQDALQNMLDSVSIPAGRSWSRASRRNYENSDIVMPGKKRSAEGSTVNIILDTSGSMSISFRELLGVIGNFCSANNVGKVRMMQCDTCVTADEFLSPEDLSEYEIKGWGGSDMSPAMLKLEDEKNEYPVIVITDGYIGYPSKVSYPVLWGILCSHIDNPISFSPPYGRVTKIVLNNWW